MKETPTPNFGDENGDSDIRIQDMMNNHNGNITNEDEPHRSNSNNNNNNHFNTHPPNNDPKLIGGVIASYFIVSISLVFLNKLIMSSNSFPYPLTVTFIQFLIAFLCFFLSSHFSAKLKNIPMFSFITTTELQIATAKKVLPVTVVYLLMLITNNLCLYYVEVSFYQVARSLTIIFTVLLTFYLLKKSTSSNALIACGVIVAGFIFGSKGEINFSLTGVLFGIFSSFFVSLYSVVVKHILGTLNDDHWKLLYYNTVISLVLLLPFVLLSGELAMILETDVERNIVYIIFINTVAGVLGFALNIVMTLQIKLTSALTNIISGTAKASLQTILAFIFFQSPVSFLNAIGILLVMGGSTAYSYIRYQEMRMNNK